jgi:hypothetical protein
MLLMPSIQIFFLLNQSSAAAFAFAFGEETWNADVCMMHEATKEDVSCGNR